MRKDVVFTSFTNDGVIDVLIRGEAYKYCIDGALVNRVRTRSYRDPWGAVNYLKQVRRWYVDPKGELHER